MLRKSTCAALALGAALAIAAPVAAQQFSADMMTTTGNGGSGPVRQKVFVSNGKMRFEGSGGHGVVITDAAAQTAVILMPAQKMYMDAPPATGRMMPLLMTLDPNNPCPQFQAMARQWQKDGGEWSCKRLGAEKVGDRNTVKYEAVSPKGEHHFAWIDPKLRFIVKTEGEQGRGMELTNIKEAPQPASLFEIPADYQKMDMSEMMKKMRPGAKPPGG